MNNKDKEDLKRLIKKKATHEYFLDKMRIKLSQLWQTSQTESRIYVETKKRHDLFIDKIDEIEENILRLVPPDTHYNYVEFKITD